MVIIISGTPGTGKTTHAKKLAEELDMSVVNITELLKERDLAEEWDSKRHCFLVDVEKLTEILDSIVSHDSNIIIDGHLSHYLDPSKVDRCIIMKCDLPELKKRLEARGYDEEKVRENLDCEIFDVCYHEALDFGHEPEVVE